MFILSRLKSLVRIDPKDFERPLPEALSDVLNAKLANKILQGECHFAAWYPLSRNTLYVEGG